METEEEPDSTNHSTELLLARVVHIIDPSNFWIQIGSKEVFERFSYLEEQLQIFCEETGTLTPGSDGGIEDGDFIAARSNLHKISAWRRAQIARQNIKKRTVDVWYLDYGTTEIISFDQICSAVPAFFFIVDSQAWKCGLAGIKPIAKTWTSRAVKYFQKLTSDTVLQASAVSYQAMFGCLQIALYTDAGKDGHSLAHKMLEEEIGMACDIELVAEYARDVQHVVPRMSQEYVFEEPQMVTDVDRCSGTAEDASQNEEREDVGVTRPEHVSDLEEGETTSEPASPGGIIPGFNLNSIFKTKMASADLIEQKKEDARKKAVTTEMAKDLEMVQKDMAENVIPTEITEWGASDYDIGKRKGDKQTDVCSLKMAEFREAIGNTDWSPCMTEGLAKQKPLLQELKVVDVPKRSPGSDTHGQRTSVTESKAGPRGSPTTGERAEASLSKQLSKILDEGDLEDPGSLCHQFNRAVSPDGVHEPRGLPVVIEVLLETAITVFGPKQISVLNVLDSYTDCANFEVRLETVLRQLANKFTKPSFGKAKTHYREFGQLLGQLLVLSRLWNKHAADVTQKFVLHLVEKWAIFNRHGYQMGVQNEKTQTVFLECLEGFWDVAANTISDIEPSSFVRVQEWIHDKVLATSHPREIRERSLQLLLKLGPVKLFDAKDVKPPTCSVEVQTEISSLHLPDTESSYQDGSSLFSQFDAEIDDTSPEAENPKHAAESSPVSLPFTSTRHSQLHHSTSIPKNPANPSSVFLPFTRPEAHNDTSMSKDQADNGLVPHPLRSQEVKNHPKTSTTSDNVDPLMSKFSSWAHCVSVGKKKPKKTDTKDIGGLKALALQTLNGEKYVFSGRFVKDLPPRFKKHLAPQETKEVERVVDTDPHFYKKSSEERSSGLDYLTPRDSSKPPVYHENCNEEASSQDSSPGRKEDEDNGQSIYTKLGLGHFPSVKDILDSSFSQTDSGSERGSRSVTPINQSVGRARSLTPGDQSPFRKRSLSGKQSDTNRSHTPVQNFRTFSPVDGSHSTESSNPDVSSEPSRGSVKKQTKTKYSRRGRGARSKKSSSRSSERSPNRNQQLQLNPNAEEWSPVKSVSKGVAQLGSGVRGPAQGKASNNKAEGSIKSIVEDIFGEGDGKNVPGHSTELSEVENMCGDKTETEGEDGHNTSFCVSEITSEMTDEKPCRSDGDERILPENNPKSEYSGQLYDEDDYDDCDDDDFFFSGFGDEVEKDFENHAANAGSCKSETSQKDVNWNTMDFSKPLDSSPQKPSAPRYQWQPGLRKCTRCGSSDHTVYSCKEKTSMIF